MNGLIVIKTFDIFLKVFFSLMLAQVLVHNLAELFSSPSPSIIIGEWTPNAEVKAATVDLIQMNRYGHNGNKKKQNTKN